MNRYDLITFSQRIPENWKPYFELVIGHPERDRDFLLERSPRTYMQQIRCPLLVIQGKNDPRVTCYIAIADFFKKNL